MRATQRFKDPLHPDGKDVLVFDFSPMLGSGETLTGVPTIAVAMALGTDATPSALLNGTSQLDATATKVLVPVQGRTEGNDYEIECTCPTTNPKKVGAISAVLSIRK